MSRVGSRRLAGPALAALLAVTGAGLSACAADEDDNALAPRLEEVPDIRGADDPDDPYRGFMDAAFRADLEIYAEQEVTVVAAVAEVLGPRAFTITAPEDGDVDPVLVVAAPDAGDVDVQVGESLVLAATPVEDLDAEAVVEELGLEVEAAQLEEWEDDTYLFATILESAP